MLKRIQLKVILIFLIFGIISSWFLKEEFFYILFNGKYFDHRSDFFQLIFFFALSISFTVMFLLLYSYAKKKNPSSLFLKKNGLDRYEKISLISLIVLIGFVIAVIFHYANGYYWGLPYPYNTFLFSPRDKFNDFFNMYKSTANLNPYFGEYWLKSNYYPLANVFFYFFTLLKKWNSFILFTTLFVATFYFIILKYFKTQEKFINPIIAFILTFLTYPFLCILDRGNIEGFLFLFLFFFLLYKNQRPTISSIFLAFAISLKVYPAVFIILLLSEKKYKQILITIASTIILTIGSLLIQKGGFVENLQFIISGFGVNDTKFFSEINGFMLGGVSLYSPIKMLLYQLGISQFPELLTWNGLLQVYSFCVMALFGLLAAYILLIEKEEWRKTAILVFIMLLFPNVSFDYKLIHIFLPLFLFLKLDRKTRMDLIYIVGLALLLVPKNYYIFPMFITNSGVTDINIGVVLNPLIMIILIVFIVRDGFREYRAKI